MRWTALVDSPEHVCCRYRLAAFLPRLAEAGVAISLVALPPSFWERMRLFSSLAGGNVILQRRLLDGLSWRMLRRSAGRIIYDFDDAMWLRDSYAPGGLRSHRRELRFARIVGESDGVFAGNEFLAARAAKHTSRERVIVLPTGVLCDNYTVAHHDVADRTRLVWIGSASTLRSLEQIGDWLERLVDHVPSLSLKLICDRPCTVRRLPVEFCRWSEATETAELATSHIGIAWMPDDDWSRGKCGLKVVQYLASGLPVVANPVGVHHEMVLPGCTGFLAATPEEWLDAIARLAAAPELRRRLGSNGRRLAESHYSIDRLAGKLVAGLGMCCPTNAARRQSA